MSNVIIGGTAPGATALPVASTIDPVNDYIPIYTNSLTATQAINRNTYLGLGSAPVGLTDTQTLTNKTLTSPTLSSPTFSGTTAGTFTLGGTITFPTSVVQLTSTQTLTNKTLTSPVINSPTITNATISTDTITGYTVSNSGTIYGIPVSTGTLSGTYITSSTITSTQIATNGVSAANLSASAITLGYASTSTTFSGPATTLTPTGLSVTVTIPSGGRRIKITVGAYAMSSTISAGALMELDVYDTTSSVEVGALDVSVPTSNYYVNPGFICTIPNPGAGSRTYQLRYAQNTSGTLTLYAGATAPIFILVEAI